MRAFSLICLITAISATAQSAPGYFRQPALHGDTIVFTAEGDLWRVGIEGGPAQRLTTHPGEERHPVISPDGRYVAFTAQYEGPHELFVMPIEGGQPTRLTFEGDTSIATGWTPGGRILYTTQHFSTLPDPQLVITDLDGLATERVPLSQAAEGAFDDTGQTVFFVRPPFHNNNTRNYVGGTARNIWRFNEAEGEAVNLTGDHPGEHHNPMWWNGRVYFIGERSGTMNLWSMNRDGGDLQQITHHDGWDVQSASISGGRIAYRLAADIRLLDLATGEDRIVPIHITSDYDQLRERWVDRPMNFLTSARVHPEGKSVALTARGRVFTAPVKQGRLVRVTREPGVRYRDVVFMPGGDQLIGLSDATGEFEFTTLPANGLGEPETLTEDGAILRYEAVPSPDGKRIAYGDKNSDLWILHLESKEHTLISTNREGAWGVAWAPDSRWIAFTQRALNSYVQIWLHNVETGEQHTITSDRVNSYSPAWDPAGDWLYFLSDRDLRSLVSSPWGPRQPEPFFDEPMRVYQVALRKGLRSPFRPDDELAGDTKDNGKKDEGDEEDEKEEPPAEPEEPDAANAEDQDPAEDSESSDETAEEDNADKDSKKKDDEPKPVAIEFEGLERRVQSVPVSSGNYGNLTVNKRALFFTQRDTGHGAKTHLVSVKITNDNPRIRRVAEDIREYQLAMGADHILVYKGDALHVFSANGDAPSNLNDTRVSLSGWSFPIDVREDWRQLYTDAWRMQRDFFYDPNMHGVDWTAKRDKYLSLVDRVTTRDELSDVIGMLMGELSALHVSVRGGDHRSGPDNVPVATLGARLERDETAGGYRVDYIYRPDPDYPEWASPLHEPGVDVNEGDIIEAINGIDLLSVRHPNEVLRNQQNRQVLIEVRTPGEQSRRAIVTPTTGERMLRYQDWKHSRRVITEEKSDNRIGYIHLSAMGGGNLSEWYREFYPVFNREGLIIDVRHNRGGNIDSILLTKLLRQAWSYWQDRVSEPGWNMQYAFRGHMVVLTNELTASDGEAFAEGFRRLGLGKVIGMRTWGGQIWLSDRNRLSDDGIARAPQMRVYGPEGEWLIEGHGVDPDIVVDNLPHATFNGEDAQLQAAIDHLLERMEAEPITVPAAPPAPDITALRP